jgi:hypothetical protein
METRQAAPQSVKSCCLILSFLAFMKEAADFMTGFD